ncbi:hypothetical protein X975_15913, partial [Stegodyphus mimosarum]
MVNSVNVIHFLVKETLMAWCVVVKVKENVVVNVYAILVGQDLHVNAKQAMTLAFHL